MERIARGTRSYPVVQHYMPDTQKMFVNNLLPHGSFGLDGRLIAACGMVPVHDVRTLHAQRFEHGFTTTPRAHLQAKTELWTGLFFHLARAWPLAHAALVAGHVTPQDFLPVGVRCTPAAEHSVSEDCIHTPNSADIFSTEDSRSALYEHVELNTLAQRQAPQCNRPE